MSAQLLYVSEHDFWLIFFFDTAIEILHSASISSLIASDTSGPFNILYIVISPEPIQLKLISLDCFLSFVVPKRPNIRPI